MMPYVKAIAQRYNSEVILLHVVNPVYAIPDPGGSAPALFPVPQRIFKRERNSWRNSPSLNFREYRFGVWRTKAIPKARLPR